MARPKKDPDEQRRERAETQLTVREKLHVQEQARLAGLSEAEYVRRRITGYEVPPSRALVEAGLVSELNRIATHFVTHQIANNLNQIAVSVHTGRDFHIPPDLVLSELRVMIKALDTALMQVTAAYDP